MSWWELADGAWLGDGPADALGAALNQAAAESLAEVVPVPDLLATVVEGITGALGDDARVQVSLGDESSEQGSPVPALRQALASALEAVVGQYRREWGRDPTPTELVHLVVFCLAPDGAGIVAPLAPGSRAVVRPDRG
ncbi:hypothetical protein [Georgenia subflava]|uniref:Uncharacterized protein n=1 Tax=Georgenia subflava TaxID=1622177 RepID=A0A6N7EJT1_9MICO|nr:hypothetical protein [Georgenia subflava]MPV37313.1 hypothetical protein [Georgenia subflava]